jgi:tetratricopeptide (TPR) repeat protein
MGLYEKSEACLGSISEDVHKPKGQQGDPRQAAGNRTAGQDRRRVQCVLSGRNELGIDILEPFLQTKFKDWWPMSYYLGVAYERTGKRKEAVDCFKRVLAINASHVETMEELANIYAAANDAENEAKYRKKAELIRSGGYKE